LRSRTKGCC